MPRIPTESELLRSSQLISQKGGRRDVLSTASSKDEESEDPGEDPTQNARMNASMPTVVEESSTNDFSGQQSEEIQFSTIPEESPSTDLVHDGEGSETNVPPTVIDNITDADEADPTVELVSELQFSAANHNLVDAYVERVEQFEAARMDL